jgi:hypothetical protein
MLNLVQIQERLKDVPMQALMQYANGSNSQVPPFLALGELNRRKKMQEGAAAEQAAEMEGAPTVKQQIEQAAGLMALQGNRQRQAAQQQQGIQAAMPMAAPNTTTSEPAQLAGGGFIDDIVVPRDYQAGGMAMNPEMIKKLMMLKAMKQRKPGLTGLPMRQDMFKRGDYAGGGIVAFAGQEGSFVETRPGFYELGEEVKKPDEEIDPQRQLAELIRRIQAVKSIEQRKREAGLGEAPDVQTEKLKAAQDERRRFEEADTITNRILSLDPYRLGSSMAQYEKERRTGMTDIDRRIAEINDLRTKSAYDAKIGNIEKARTEELDAITKEQAIIKDIGDVGYKLALTRQSEAGRSSEGDRAARAYVNARKAAGDTRSDDVLLSEGYMAVFGARGAAAQRAATGAESTDVQTVNLARDNVDARLKIYTSPETRELMKRKQQDQNNAAAGNPTNLADQYRQQLYRDEEDALRRKQAPARPTGGSSQQGSQSDPLGIRR